MQTNFLARTKLGRMFWRRVLPLSVGCYLRQLKAIGPKPVLLTTAVFAANLGDRRQEYDQHVLDDSGLPDDPIQLLHLWIEEAERSLKVTEPNAMLIATVDAANHFQPSARVVLLKHLDEKGLVFYTNYGSKKAREIESHDRIAATFWWPEMHRSVRVQGRVARVSAEESDHYFSIRPRGSQLGAWASQQSQPIESREALDAQYAAVAEKFRDSEKIPRPDQWGGYRITVESMEFWKGGSSRLHDRILFKMTESGQWAKTRLQP
jgi:pyridoxamine 5'-phosphate oxidase